MKTRSFLPRSQTRVGHVTRVSSHDGPLGVPGRIEDVVYLDVAIVLDVLHLLPVPVWLLKSLDNESGSRGADGNLRNDRRVIRKYKFSLS